MNDKSTKTVTTYNGKKALKSNCRYIKGAYYEKNNQCYLVNGKWYRINSGYLIYDHETFKYTLKNNYLSYGIVNFENGAFKFGYYSANKARNVSIITDSSEIIECISEEILKNLDYIEVFKKGAYRFIKKGTKVSPDSIHPYKNTERLHYNAYKLIDSAKADYIKNYFKSKPTSEYSKYSKRITKLKGTFGMEFETNAGRIPSRILYRTGLMPLRDGSIRGDEYVTIPFNTNVKDLFALEDIVSALKTYTSYNGNNSFHVHQKVVSFDKNFFTATFLLNSVIEKEISLLFSKFCMNTNRYKSSGKNYNNKLLFTSIKNNISGKHFTNTRSGIFNILYNIYSGGYSFTEMGESTSIGHPSDSSNNHKWNVGIRYTWVNLVPLLFNGTNTVEYRIHPPTNNFNKILAWLIITNAILQFSNKHKLNIIDRFISSEKTRSFYNISLIDILSDIYGKDSVEYSLGYSYIIYRKKLRIEMDDKEDYAGKYELTHDDEFIPV